jgi:hypothetical protein
MPAHPIQVHILITHDSGRTAERTYLRDEDGWAVLSRMTEFDGRVNDESEYSLDHANDALMDALLSVHSAFGTMLTEGEAPLASLVPVDTRPQNPGAMN